MSLFIRIHKLCDAGVLLQRIVHQRINIRCLMRPGQCFYFEYCGFESSDVEALKGHMRTAETEHKENEIMKTEKMAKELEKLKQEVSY